MTPQEFEERFRAAMLGNVAGAPDGLRGEMLDDLSEFVRFDAERVAALPIADADKALLVMAGLPRLAPNMLFFGPDHLDLLAPIDGMPDTALLGANGYGDLVALDLSDGSVAAYNAERQLYVMNQDIVGLAVCLIVAADHIDDHDDDIDEFRAGIASDPIASAPGSWWLRPYEMAAAANGAT